MKKILFVFASIISLSTCVSGSCTKKYSFEFKLSKINTKSKYHDINKIKLMNSDNELYLYYELKDCGYFIQRTSDGAIIEYCKDSKGPFYNVPEDSKYYYGGPMNYFYLDNSNYVDAITNKSVQINETNMFKFTTSTSTFSSNDLDKLVTSAYIFLNNTDMSYSYIDNYELIDDLSNFKKTNSSKHYNGDGRCTYIAGAMVLYYSKYIYNQNFIRDNYIETYQGVRRFTFDFTQHLVDIGKSLGYDEVLVSAYDIQNIMKTYCESEGIYVDHYAMALSTPINIDLCISNNKPMVLMGYFKDPYTEKKATHSVCCYGLATMPLGIGQTQRYFIVNYGWSSSTSYDYSHVLLLDNIFTNPVGGMYNINY